MERETWIDLAIRDVCELDPPKECPEAVYIRVDDLRQIIERHAEPRSGVGDGFGPLSDDPKAHAHRAALNGVLDAARALADCNLPGGAPLGMFNRLIGAFTLYDHVRLGGA